MAVDAEAHKVAGPHGGVGQEGLLLRDVADQPAAPFHRVAAEGRMAGVQFLQPQQHLEEAGLAAAVRSQDREELPRLDVQVQVFPERAPAELQGSVAAAG